MIIGAGVLGADAIPGDRLQSYQELAVRWMQEYLRIDTTNPPGHELAAAEWFKKIFDAEGIENRLFEYAPDSFTQARPLSTSPRTIPCDGWLMPAGSGGFAM